MRSPGTLVRYACSVAVVAITTLSQTASAKTLEPIVDGPRAGARRTASMVIGVHDNVDATYRYIAFSRPKVVCVALVARSIWNFVTLRVFCSVI